MRAGLLALTLALASCGHSGDASGPSYAARSALAECDPAECGPAPDDEALLCRTTGLFTGPTGRCLRDEAGVCSWEIATCDTGSILTEQPRDRDDAREAKPH